MLTSRQLHPVHRAITLFFAGLSRDSYARNMSLRSPLLLHTLDEAKISFQQAAAAAAILPGLSTPSGELGTQYITEEGIRRGGTLSSRSSLGSQESLPALSSNDTTISDESNNENEDHDAHPCRLTRTTISRLNPPIPTSKTETSLEPHTKKHTHSYNELLTGLHLLICKHIASVESYRQFVQAARERERRFGTLLPSKQMTKEEKYDRITQGKARNWKRARFNPRHYQELCDRALGEL